MAATADAKPLATVTIPREGKEESQFRIVMRRFRRHKLAVISLVVIVVMFVLALLAPIIAPFPRDAVDIAVATRPGPPGTLSSTGQMHLLGVDHLGRDLLTRVLYGARVSLTIAFIVVIFQEGIGVALGALSGFYGGWLDNIISRTVEFLLSLPTAADPVAHRFDLDPQRRPDTCSGFCHQRGGMDVGGACRSRPTRSSC